MSTRFASAEQYGSIEDVRDAYPGAVEILEVEGGWIVFVTEAQFESWRRQSRIAFELD
jgi:hypothetical protein